MTKTERRVNAYGSQQPLNGGKCIVNICVHDTKTSVMPAHALLGRSSPEKLDILNIFVFVNSPRAIYLSSTSNNRNYYEALGYDINKDFYGLHHKAPQ